MLVREDEDGSYRDLLDLRDVSLRVMLEWSRREHEPSMIEIEALVRFVPKDQDLRAGVQFSFLFF